MGFKTGDFPPVDPGTFLQKPLFERTKALALHWVEYGFGSPRKIHAVYMAKLAPTGMIFIPCKDGISHNEIEDAKPEHITAGCNVLLHAMLERAGVC